MLKIIFTTSKSKRFKEALSLAKKLSYEIKDESYVVKLELSEVFNKWEYINSLLHIIDKWKDFEISYNNVVCTTNKDYRSLFYAIQEVRRCYHNRIRLEVNCKGRHELGCWRLKCVSLKPTDQHSNYWYKFGFFIDENTWAINKEALIEYIQEEIKSTHTNLCPMFSFAEVEETINNLPSHINVGNLSKWKILYHDRFTKDGLTRIPYSIEHLNEGDARIFDDNNYIPKEDKLEDLSPEEYQDMWWKFPKGKELTESEKADLIIDEYLRRKHGKTPF